MGWSYRKSLDLGPFRVNLSKSGIGYSVGAKDFRVGVNAKGRRYESVTVPGTGLSYRTSSGRSKNQGPGCARRLSCWPRSSPPESTSSFSLIKVIRMALHYSRTVRTESSERFLLQSDSGHDAAALGTALSGRPSRRGDA